MRKILVVLLTALLSINSYSQDYWKNYRKADGLVDSVIVDLAVEGNKVYIATPRGFSIFDNGVFSNYDTSNSSLPSQNIQKIRVLNDVLYLVTDSGLTQFSNGNMTHYTWYSSNLISNAIEDIEIASNGDLYIGTKEGLSIKRGNTFTNDSSRVIFDLGINSGDSVYVNVTNSAIVNVPNRVFSELYFKGIWETWSDTAFNASVLNAKFISLSDGTVGITSASKKAFQINNKNQLRTFNIPDQVLSTAVFRLVSARLLQSMDISSDSSIWFTLSGTSTIGAELGVVYQYKNQSFITHRIGLSNIAAKVVVCSNDKIYVGTRNGLSITSNGIQEYPENETLETSSLRANFNSKGDLFTIHNERLNGNNQFANGLEFPKNSGEGVAYNSSYWMKADGLNNLLYLSSREYQQGNYTEGTINNNYSAFRPNLHKISKADISFHLQNYTTTGYQMPRSVKNWPAIGRVDLGEFPDQAPFVDVNNNGCYDPENGDYPSISGDEAIYIITNDKTGNNAGFLDRRLEMEIHTMVYSYNIPSVDYIDRSIFVNSTFVNRSNREYRNVKLGYYMDGDIGTGSNDAVGCDLSSNSFFTYGASLKDTLFNGTPAYGKYAPFLGVKYTNQRLDGFIQPYANLAIPRSSVGRSRNYLDALWGDSLPISVGGNGYNRPVNQVTKHLYSGRLNRASEWSFVNPGGGFQIEDGSDARMLGITEVDSWKPGERITLHYVVSVAQDSSRVGTSGNYEVLLQQLDRAARFQQGVDSIRLKGVYASCVVGVTENVTRKKNENKVLIYPNPNQGAFSVLANNSLESIVVYTIQGALVYEKTIGSDFPLVEIELPESLTNGLYFLRAQFKSSREFHAERIVLQR
jgi:hypothetical protein